MKDRSRLILFALIMTLLAGIAVTGCSGGGSSSAPSGSGTLSGSAK